MKSNCRNETAERSAVTAERKARECYDRDEVRATLRELSEETIKRIQGFARFLLMSRPGRSGYVEPEDLFIDAAIRSMEHRRGWKRGVSPFNHFLAVMRSIGHQRMKQASRYTPLTDTLADTPKWSLSGLDAQASVARLKEQLQGDAIALTVLDSMMDEMRPRDTQQSLSMSSKVYWAARKRIRRQAEALPGAPCHRRRPSAAKAAGSVGASTGRAGAPYVTAKKVTR